jgi:hypothetical protein
MMEKDNEPLQDENCRGRAMEKRAISPNILGDSKREQRDLNAFQSFMATPLQL